MTANKGTSVLRAGKILQSRRFLSLRNDAMIDRSNQRQAGPQILLG
jgi:hypothetical protein